MNLSKTSVLLILCLSLFVSCSSKTKVSPSIEEKIQNTDLANKSEIKKEVYRDILESNSLSNEQKEALTKLYENSKEKDNEIQEEIEKAKLVLTQTLIQKNMSTNDYNALKLKISKLYESKVNNMFIDAENARKIINKSNFTEQEKQRFHILYMNHFIKK